MVTEEAVTALAARDNTSFVDEKRPSSDPTVGRIHWVCGNVCYMRILLEPGRVLGVTRAALLLGLWV